MIRSRTQLAVLLVTLAVMAWCLFQLANAPAAGVSYVVPTAGGDRVVVTP